MEDEKIEWKEIIGYYFVVIFAGVLVALMIIGAANMSGF